MKFEYRDYELSNAIIDIAAGPFGSNLKVSCFTETGFPIIDGANLKGITVTDNITKFVSEDKARSLHRSIAKRRDIVVTISGNVGQISYIPDNSQYAEYLCSQRQFRVTFDESKIYVPYLVYYLHSVEGRSKILAFANQTGVPALSQPLKNFRKIKIDLPSLENQHKIADILSTLDEKIAINRAINDNLLEQASSIYQAWFEDFILSDGSCPPSWKQGTLAGIADITSGKRPPVKSAEKTDNAIIPIVGAASVMGYTTEANHTDKILVTGRVGTHGVVQRFNSPCWASDNTLVITSAFYEYTFQILQRIDYRTLNRGSTQPLITQGDMNKVPILIPDNETLLKFETLVGQLMKQYQVNLLENDKLAELRDALLPKLMSGKIDVSSVQL